MNLLNIDNYYIIIYSFEHYLKMINFKNNLSLSLVIKIFYFLSKCTCNSF